jgi:hypothetical protein
MVRQEAWLTLPSRDTVIWRYMDTWKFVEMVRNSALWFNRGDQFDDTIEGVVPPQDAQHIRSSTTLLASESLAIWLEAFGTCLRRNTLVNCWHVNVAESLRMWQQYVRTGSGVVLKSTVGKLAGSFAADDPRLVCIGEVRYVDHSSYRMDPVGLAGLDWRLPTGSYMEAPGGYRPLIYKE